MPHTQFQQLKYANKWVCDVGLGRGNYCGGLYSGLRDLWHVHDFMDMAMTNALAHSVTVVGAGWSRSQEWMPCARVLWNSLHSPRPNPTAQGDDGVARQECALLQVNRIHGDLEQSSRVGGHGRLHMVA